ncbi:MAG: hypothetical protein JST75_01760 [Bacteroidetes bacterium]|nr:hypothetical protein [Bacteroidota bacterium]
MCRKIIEMIYNALVSSNEKASSFMIQAVCDFDTMGGWGKSIFDKEGEDKSEETERRAKGYALSTLFLRPSQLSLRSQALRWI